MATRDGDWRNQALPVVEEGAAVTVTPRVEVGTIATETVTCANMKVIASQ
jgi:hypothetical protein